MNHEDQDEASKKTEEVVDEFCPNSEYEKDDSEKSKSKTSV